MSADLEIAGGLILLPVALAALPIIGAGYAIYKGAAALQRHNEKVRQRQIEEERIQRQMAERRNEINYSKMIELRNEYQSVVTDFNDTMWELERDFSQKMTEFVTSFEQNAMHIQNVEFKEFEENAERRRNQIISEFNNQREALYRAYASQIESTFTEISTKIADAHDGIQAFETLLKDDPRKATIAEEMIETAKTMLALYQIESGESATSLANDLNSAIEYYNSRDYDISYGKASAIVSQCLQRIQETKMLQREYYSLIDDISDKLFIIQERLAKARSVQIPYNDDLIEEDITRFEPVLFMGLQKQLLALQKRFEAINGYRRNAIPELRTLLSDFDDLELDVLSISKFALAKCIFAFSENDEAEIVTDALEEQGFHMVDYAYESQTEGNAMHVNYENDISKEKITVVFTPTEHGVQVMVHNFGADNESNGNAQTQRAIQIALEGKLGRQSKCERLGEKSSNLHSANLDDVRAASSSNADAAQKLADSI